MLQDVDVAGLVTAEQKESRTAAFVLPFKHVPDLVTVPPPHIFEHGVLQVEILQ